MALASLTTDFMRRFPAGLRPNPYNIEETLMILSANGWGVEDMVTAVMADRPQQPGHVVARLRRMQDEPAPMRSSTSNRVRDMRHAPCGDSTHGGSCELCYCNVCRPNCTIGHEHERWPSHHINTTAPQWFAQRFKDTMGRYGYIAD